MADDDEGGYGKPPKHSRFKKGQSGNPRGRPRGTPNLTTAIANVMKSKVPVRKGDQTLWMSSTDAIAHKLFQQTLALRDLIEYGRLSDAFADAIQKSTPFAPEDLEILQEALARQKPDEPPDSER
jgi:Family of unknown function (DUF5681)